MATDDSASWAQFDAERLPAAESKKTLAPLKFAFYGRCSTEDNQDPKTSHDWQIRAANSLIWRSGGTVAAEFFDIGYSRSLPWKRRPEAQRLLTELRSRDREWTAVVVGEGQRCWYGSQFSEVAPLIEQEKLPLWVPELGGPYDPKNASHFTLMTLTGGMSRGERQRIQERVRLAMAAQVENFGRWQGGRPPYGYMTEVTGPHPNPRKAAEGYMAKRLVPDPTSAPIALEIFRLRLAGSSPANIAAILNASNIPCPSAHDPRRNKHRNQNGWQAGTVHTILENGRYTGYEFWGKYEKREELFHPDDPSFGYRTKLTKADPAKLVRSREKTHEGLVSVEDFLAVQAMWKSRPSARNRPAAAVKSTPSPYALRGLIRCRYCGNVMEGSRRTDTVLYRCRSFKKTPGVARDENHQGSISVSERSLITEINAWIETIFSTTRRAQTIAALTEADSNDDEPVISKLTEKLSVAERERQNLEKIITRLSAKEMDIETWLRRIEENAETIQALKDEIAAFENRSPARAPEVTKTIAKLEKAAKSIFSGTQPQELWEFYKEIGLQISYAHHTHEAEVTVRIGHQTLISSSMGGGNPSVRRGMFDLPPLTTCLVFRWC